MRYFITAALFVFLLSGCASQSTAMKPLVTADAAKVKTVYVWDADGNSDINLLRALKAEAQRQLREKGLLISDNAASTDAYVKITVLDGSRNADTKKTFVIARLYALGSMTGELMYDKTAQATAKGGKQFEAPEYPVREEVKELLSDWPTKGAK